MRGKRGSVINQVLIQIILIALVFAVFITANAEKINSRGIRQEIIEKQTALLIEAAVSGMSFEVEKLNGGGFIEDIRVKNGRIYVDLEGLRSIDGYPFFTRYSVDVIGEGDSFIILIK